ncbi:MerR family transcriptional regulator [Nissabacter sp. SGAir0207]|uniref:MerR family transcriptional regulator n=1 Tax=Nissabacter sp. SGAir0207 TaxID=2126321 RepID=UPI0010CD02C1|nr:MerR family transcriptional regulator [Nissabacter sp. SGAir0207]QCR36665.1 helix-turn-helix-type transcriptional regulator [Nissabacter sp. SGAir0207]
MRRYSIGEVAAICGINPVTLRAWQRRYGLLKPQRTEGGHRLFDDEDLARIRTILTWIERGVPVGQVRALLENGGEVEQVGDGWAQLTDALLVALQGGQLNRLRQMLNEYGREYPAGQLVDQVLRPLRARLASGNVQLLTLRSLLDGLLLEYAAFCLTAGRKTPGEHLMIIGWGRADRADLWLEGLKRSEAGARVEVLTEPLAAPQLEPLLCDRFVLWSEGRLSPAQQQQFLAWQAQGLNVELMGSAATLQSDDSGLPAQ